jgi:uncharacterized metal-binding protein YceD (DUF177 family)
MDFLSKYNIPFTGLKLGKHTFEYDLDDTFFENYSYTEISPVQLKGEVILDKKNTFMELFIAISGSVTLICDITGEKYVDPLQGKMDLIVKFGESYNDEDDVVLIIPHDAYQLNVAQFLYETTLLSLPVKRTHPGLADGTLKSDVLDKLKELEVKGHDYIDPRWDKLNELLTSKKQQNGTS